MNEQVGSIGSTARAWDAALDSAEHGAMVVDPVLDRVLHFNEPALALTGLSGFAFSATRTSSLFPDQLAALTGLSLECLTQGHAWSQELELVGPDATMRPVELFLSHFATEGRDLILFLLHDLKTIRARRAAFEVKQFYRGGRPHEQRFEVLFRHLQRGDQMILHAAGEGIYGVNAKGETTFLNPAAERMLGWRCEDLIGRTMHSVIHHSHEDGSHYTIKACPIYAAFRDGKIHRVVDEVFWRRDGTCFPVEYTSTPIQENGRLLGAVVVFRDVSTQRRAQTELRQALAEVENLKRRLEAENAYLQDELRSNANHTELVGDSLAVRTILRQIELVGPTSATVLITGESGTGKELIARAIHDASPRRERPLIRVNCSAIPRELFESEFFGHSKGSFTGAVRDRVGRFELADGGTIFLDEVGELPLDQQAKLLRVLQEQQIERVGESHSRKIDVRVIAATNRNLKEEAATRRFREDLFFRLNVFPINSPPLRDRPDDIPLLTLLFVQRACSRAGRPELPISLADVERLKAYHWPGNIRELENVVERAVITAVDGRLRFDLPSPIGYDVAFPAKTAAQAADVLSEDRRKTLERENLIAVLRICGGRVSGRRGAAEIIGVPATTLYSRLKRFQIDARHYRNEEPVKPSRLV
jgi:PAS domain S-box-containing protein